MILYYPIVSFLLLNKDRDRLEILSRFFEGCPTKFSAGSVAIPVCWNALLDDSD
jgi:hypothetical protein